MESVLFPTSIWHEFWEQKYAFLVQTLLRKTWAVLHCTLLKGHSSRFFFFGRVGLVSLAWSLTNILIPLFHYFRSTMLLLFTVRVMVTMMMAAMIMIRIKWCLVLSDRLSRSLPCGLLPQHIRMWYWAQSTQNTEHSTSGCDIGHCEHRTVNTEQWAQSTMHRTQNTEHRTQNREHRTQNTPSTSGYNIERRALITASPDFSPNVVSPSSTPPIMAQCETGPVVRSDPTLATMPSH